jgi:hypothetical protein
MRDNWKWPSLNFVANTELRKIIAWKEPGNTVAGQNIINYKYIKT